MISNENIYILFSNVLTSIIFFRLNTDINSKSDFAWRFKNEYEIDYHNYNLSFFLLMWTS